MSSLTGEMLYQSLEILAPYGAYLEIGKVSAIDDLPLPMKIFNKNLSFFSIDIDQLCKNKPNVVSKLLHDTVAYIDSGKLAPLPTKVFEAKDVFDAFTWIEQGDYIGKAVVNFKDQ